MMNAEHIERQFRTEQARKAEQERDPDGKFAQKPVETVAQISAAIDKAVAERRRGREEAIVNEARFRIARRDEKWKPLEDDELREGLERNPQVLRAEAQAEIKAEREAAEAKVMGFDPKADVKSMSSMEFARHCRKMGVHW